MREFRAEVRELASGGEHSSHRGWQVVDRDFYLRRSHPFVCRYQPLRQQVAAGVVDEQRRVSIAVVLSDVLSERVQRLGDVSNRRKYG